MVTLLLDGGLRQVRIERRYEERMIKPTELQTQRFFSCMGKKDVPSALR